jgi:DNA-binding GntR family transcriptional regulator
MSGKANPLGEQLFRQIVDTIYSGKLAPGSEVNEAVLAERFGVSRGPVREALRRLQGIGLVSREPYFRARVISLRVEEVVELFQMREALEGMACRLAAERMTKEEIASLGADLEAQRKAVISKRQDPGARAFDFHERVLLGAKNARIANLLCGDLYQLLRLYRRRSGAENQRRQEAYEEHWQILRAIKNADPGLAESLMRSHVARASDNIVRALKATGAESDSDIARHP